MKRKMASRVFAAVMVAALVTGCGSTAQAPADAQAQEEDIGMDEADTAEEADKAEEPTAEEPAGNEENYDYYIEDTDVSMEELREANTPANMIGTHQSLGYTWENYDAQENLQSTVKGQFLMHDGKLWHDAVFTSASGESNYYSDYEADDSPGATYEYMEGVESGAYWLTIYPSDEYRYWVSQKWMPDLYPEQKEEIFDISTQDGAILLQVRTTYTDMDNYGETLYYVEPGTNLILYRETSWYDKDGNLLSVDKYTPVYDEPYVSDQIAKGNVSGAAEDACHLTVIFNPAREDQEVQEFDIVKGTLVNVTSNEDYSLYSSGDCTEKIDTIDTNADETTVYVMRNGHCL